MTDRMDDRMDARLRAAGERWRDENAEVSDAAAPEEATVKPTPAPTPRRGRVGLIASAAVVAGALVVGGALTLGNLGDGDRTSGGKADLVGTVWLLHDGKTKSSATLYVGKGGNLVADDECTIVGAKVRPRGGTLWATDVQVRRRDCIDQYGPRLGDGFVKLLRSKPAFSAGAKSLSVGTYDFTAAPELPHPTIDVPTWDEARWRLVDASNRDGRAIPEAFLRVDRGSLQASDSCNEYFGEVQRRGTTVTSRGIQSSPIGRATPARCTLDIGEILKPPFSASIDNAVLTVTKKHVGQLTYRWTPEDPKAVNPTRLVGPTWRLAGVAGDPAAGHATLRFPTTTTYEANDGCRTFRGTATLSTGAMQLSGVPQSTATGCAKEKRDQAGTIDSFLSGALFSIRDGKLLIYGGGAQAFSLVYAGGGQDEAQSPGALDGTWTLTRVLWSDSSGSFRPPHETTLRLTGGRFLLRDDCLQRSAAYAATATMLKMVESRTTPVKKCTDPGFDSQVDPISWSLVKGVKYRLDGPKLVLTTRGVVLTFEKK